MYALTGDPIERDHVIDNSGFTEFVDLGGGIVALKTWDGKYVSQEPNAWGVFRNVEVIGPYEKFGGGAGIGVKTAWTRPDKADQVLSYFCVQLPNA